MVKTGKTGRRRDLHVLVRASRCFFRSPVRVLAHALASAAIAVVVVRVVVALAFALPTGWRRNAISLTHTDPDAGWWPGAGCGGGMAGAEPDAWRGERVYCRCSATRRGAAHQQSINQLPWCASESAHRCVTGAPAHAPPGGGAATARGRLQLPAGGGRRTRRALPAVRRYDVHGAMPVRCVVVWLRERLHVHGGPPAGRLRGVLPLYRSGPLPRATVCTRPVRCPQDSP